MLAAHKALRHSHLGVGQGGEWLGVEDERGALPDFVGAPDKGGRHFDHGFHIATAVAGNDDRLRGVEQHGLVLVHKVGPRRRVIGDPHGHDEVDVGQGVAEPRQVAHVLLGAWAPLPRVQVDVVGTV